MTIEVAPESRELSIDQGKSATTSVDVVNKGDAAFSFNIYVTPYWVKDGTYVPILTQVEGRQSADSWVHLSDTAATVLAPNATHRVDVDVTVPAGTAPGSYYAAILAEATQDNATVLHTNARVGTILYVHVTGPSAQTRLGDVSINYPSFAITTSLPFDVELNNPGQVYYRATTTLTLRDIFNREFTPLSTERYVLPQTTRTLHVDWGLPLPFGIYHGTLRTEANGQVVTKDISFLAISPAALLITGIIVVILLAWLAYNVSRYRKKRKKGLK